MAFRIHDLSIHLTSETDPDDVLGPNPQQGPPCTNLSAGRRPCGGQSDPCKRKTDRPRDRDEADIGPEKRGLAFLQAQLRETLSPPPL